MGLKIGGHVEDEDHEAALNCDLGERGDLFRRSRAVKDKTTAMQAPTNSIA